MRCDDCGTEFESAKSNAKYCRVCRLLRNVIFIGNKTKECWTCGERFAPLDRNDTFCGKCNTVKSVHDAKGKCVMCKDSSDQLLHRSARVCRSCAYIPDLRPTLARALKKKQDAVRSEVIKAAGAIH